MITEVPAQLKERRQWMLWRDEYGTKVPYQTNGHRAKPNDPTTWTDFDEVCGNSHIAFCFSPDDPFCGVDLDDCITDGIWEPWAQEILNKFEGVAYAEISPSGHGVKLITIAKKAEKTRCKNNKGVECYDFARFWTITGNVVGDKFRDIGNGQEAIDWLLSTHLAGSRGPTGEKRTSPSAGGSFELLSRAEAYIDAVPAGKKGNLRNTAFQTSGHLHAMVGENGERLSDTDVLGLLRRWNLRNTDQLRDDELKEAAINGRKNGTPPADKPPPVTPLVTDDIDLSGILSQAIEKQVSDVPFSPGDFPRETIPTSGIIGQVVAWNLATAMYPQPELAFSGALALMSVLTGRKVETEYKTRTNLYILGIGESGTGKEHARKVNKEILYAAECESMVGPERMPSSAGVVSALTERLALLYQIDEIGHLLATMKNPGKSPHLYNIATVLMQLYSSSDSVWIGDCYADTKKTPTINQPHAVLYGTSTPSRFWSNLTPDSVQDGLLGRMLAFECPGYVERQQPLRVDIPGQLVDQVREWGKYVPGGIDISRPVASVASHTSEAYQRFEEHLDGIHDRRKDDQPAARAVWSRTGEKTAKLALIFACSRQSPGNVLVELDDVERAIKVSNWLTRRMLRQAYDYVSENQVEDQKKRVLRILSDEMDRTTLAKKTQWLRSKERNDILAELIDSGMVAMRHEDTPGRPRTFFKRTH